ncbi:Hypothetical predicted protein [Mytilus galloprovincialis]|uniref:Uncharacterized protein n=1 Tax=Mytilus galloprovincialis TaxID=29158 RepID=A0A8B6FL81_MYTGA|nr:Hypothetical predicted protein [Mytilus galloprovincialis]
MYSIDYAVVLVQNSTCSIHICLHWTTRKGVLKIICQIDDLILPVSIQNNLGEEIARCSIPFPNSLCTPRYKNIAILQNLSTNETIVKVKGRIDQRINGNWSCRHGFGKNKYEANIEINIQTLKEENTSKETDGQHFKRIVSVSELIDKCFEIKICENHSVKHAIPISSGRAVGDGQAFDRGTVVVEADTDEPVLQEADGIVK